MVVSTEFVQHKKERILTFEFAGANREQRTSIAESEKSDLKWWLRTIASATQVTVGGIDNPAIWLFGEFQPLGGCPFESIDRQQKKVVHHREMALISARQRLR